MNYFFGSISLPRYGDYKLIELDPSDQLPRVIFAFILDLFCINGNEDCIDICEQKYLPNNCFLFYDALVLSFGGLSSQNTKYHETLSNNFCSMNNWGQYNTTLA